MTESVPPHTLFFSVSKALYFLLPLPVSWLSISLMGKYMQYYDVGVNPGANNGTLLFFVLPVLPVILYLVQIVGLYIVNRFFKSKYLGLLFTSLVVLSIGIGAFFIQIRVFSDYPTEKTQNLRIFLEFYLQKTT